MKKNPLEGKEIRMAEGIVYEPYCKCGCYGFGMHIVQKGEKFNKIDVEGAACPECRSGDVKWHPAGYSGGDIVMKKGWKSKNRNKE